MMNIVSFFPFIFEIVCAILTLMEEVPLGHQFKKVLVMRSIILQDIYQEINIFSETIQELIAIRQANAN